MIIEGWNDGAEISDPDHIEYYYDRHTKLWIIQIIAKDGYEYADEEYKYTTHEYHGVKNRDSVIMKWCSKYDIKAIKV